MAGQGYPAIIDLASDPDNMSARDATPEVASSTALVPEGFGFLDTPLGPDIARYDPPFMSASGNAVPIHTSNTNVLNQHLHVHQAPSTDARLIEAVAEERHRHAMDIQGEQLNIVSAQRDEMRMQGLRFMNEAEQMFHENTVVKQEATAFVEAAQRGYEAYAEASAAELRSMKQHHESQMLDARIRSDHAIEKCMATIDSLNNHVERQNRQTESLQLELRQSMKKQTDLQSQLSALRDARFQNDLFSSWSAVRAPEGPAVLGPRGLPMIPAGGNDELQTRDYSPSIPNPTTLRQTVKQEPKGTTIPKNEPTEESLFGSPLNSMRSGEGVIPPLPLGTSDQTGKAPNGAPGGDPPPPQPEGGNGPPKGDEAKGNLRPNPKKANVGGGGPPDEPGDDDDGDGDDDDDDDDDHDDGNLSGRDLLNALKQLLKGKKKSSENNAKEADHIKVPPFPYPESYRDWKIKVRDAVRAASKTPDKAFVWINKVWKEGTVTADLVDPEGFTTLDAKLLSALSNICSGEFARKVNTFKEKESAADRPVRGRQVLLMMDEFFSTNIKHGATYSLKDLFAVKLKGENLRTFISNWDTVNAGITHPPDPSVLETLFYEQVKNVRAIQHDIEIYNRAEEGTDNHSYKYLVDAVQRYLRRERLESNRDRIHNSLGGPKPSTPAVDDDRKKTPFIPKGYCVAWNKGSCTKENCTYKHETPPKKTRKPSRGRSTSREGKDKSKITCKYWKAGRCKRGSDCEFSHAGKQKPRKATPARSGSRSSRGSDKKDKRKKDKRGKRDKSGRRSGSDGSRKSKGSKGSGGSNRSSPRVTPAAVCLVASMLASSVEGLATGNGWPSIACPAKIRVKFESKPTITEYHTSGSLFPYEVERKSPSKFYPIEFAMSPNPSAIEDSLLSAKMLAGAVQNELQGFDAKCRYMCKSTIGCDHCIPKTLYATPAASEQQVEHYLLSGEDWIADTGSAQDLATKYDIPDRYQFFSNQPISIITANGESSSYLQGKVRNETLGCNFTPYLLESTPPVMSVGVKCMDEGYDFVWRAGKEPYFQKPDGVRIKLTVRDYVPYVPSKIKKAMPCKLRSRPVIDAGIRAGASSSSKCPPSTSSSTPTPLALPAEVAKGSDDAVGDDDVSRGDKEEASRKAEPPSAADRKVEPPTDDSNPSDDALDDQVPGPLVAERGRGEALLKREANSITHLMTHIPKNEFCDVCRKAKMIKYPSRARGGSRQIEAESFGDHVTGDFLITAKGEEAGDEDEGIGLVLKDVYSGFTYVYPSARKDAESTINSFKHFVLDEAIVKIFYSDNAPELISAARTLQWRHVTSKDYISQSNAVAERTIRSIVEGTRVSLLQSGLHHQYWPHAARHWCVSNNIAQFDDEDKSPWELRFGERFKGPIVPFGCKIDYWTGPRKRVKDNLRFDPTSAPGIFIGYILHPGCLFRDEFAVMSLPNVLKASHDEKIPILRVSQISVPKAIEFPMQKDKIIRSEGRVELIDQPELPPLEDQDAKMNQPDSFPVEKLERDIKPNADAIGGKAVWNAAWLAFLRTKNPDGSEKLGWFAYGGCQVNLELFAGEFCDPRPTHDTKDYPVRSTVMQSGDDSWHVIEENKTIHPWQNEFKSPLPEYGYIASIFSKSDIELRVREAEKDKDVDEGEIEVIDPATAKVERIKANDPRYYSADGFKARRYKGSSKPMHIPPFVWQQMSVGQRRKAIEREQKKIATEEAESKAKTSTKKKPSTPAAASPPEGEAELEVIPAMPTLNRQQRRHREKLLSMTGWQLEKAVNGLVARPVNRKEILSNPKAKESLDVEWKKLENKKAWIYESVREWFDVAKEAKKLGKKVHIGKVFEICVEKGSELPADDPLRKFKGRTVFQGNNVRDENADVALFSELGSSPATMEAGKVVDAYGSQPGFTAEQADGKQAYTQALMKGVDTWVELPRDRWPKEWIGKYNRPACKLRIALYGHPDSGGLWEIHCERMLVELGFFMPDPEGWPSVFFHDRLKLLLVVYVDDFKMSGPKESMKRGWELIGSKIDMDKPGTVGRYLGCDHVFSTGVKLRHHDHPFAHVFDKSLPDPAAVPATAAQHRTQDYWDFEPGQGYFIRHHVQPRKSGFWPAPEIASDIKLSGERLTIIRPCTPEGVAEDVHEVSVNHHIPHGKSPSYGRGAPTLLQPSATIPKRCFPWPPQRETKGQLRTKLVVQTFRILTS